jgi:hypothetical protein
MTNHTRPLASAIAQSLPPQDQRGFGLLGLIVTLALSAAVVGVGFTVYIQGDRARRVSLEASNAQAISTAIRTSYASASNYTMLTQTSALRDKLFPSGLLRGGQVQSTWGAPIVVSSTGGGKGYLIEYDNVPDSSCARFAVAGGEGFAGVNVNGQSVIAGKSVDVASAVTLCSPSPHNTIQFINYRPGATASGNPVLTQCVVQPDKTQPAACPSGQISSVSPYGPNGVTQGRSSSCPQPYGPVVWTPWTPIASTCAPICSAPPTATGSGTQPASCPAGQVTASGAASFTQTRTTTTTYSCPAPTGPYTTNPTTYGAWSPTVASACAPACVAPATATGSQTQTIKVTPGCPAPQTGNYYYSQNQTRTTSTTYSCPAPTGPYTTNPTTYGAWSNSGAGYNIVNTCSTPWTGSWVMDYFVDSSESGYSLGVLTKLTTAPASCFPATNSTFTTSLNLSNGFSYYGPALNLAASGPYGFVGPQCACDASTKGEIYYEGGDQNGTAGEANWTCK